MTVPEPHSTPAGPGRPEVAGTSLARIAELLGLAHPPTDPQVTGVTLDSRAVRPGDLYAGLQGANVHGARFASQAQAAGARALLTDQAGAALAAEQGCTLPVLVVEDPRARLGEVSATIYRRPAERLAVIGVTGTNGKTTTTSLMHGALTALGRTAGLIGTIETRIGRDAVRAVRTTPESPDLHALLAVMAEQDVQACAMEVSSHALTLHRVDGVRFQVAAFTNLSQDHLDFHPTMEDYFAAKASLFDPERCGAAVICVDDEWGARLAAATRVPTTTVATTRTTNPQAAARADWTLREHRPFGTGSAFTLTHTDGTDWQLTCPLPGDYNITNTALAALCLAHPALAGLGLSRDDIAAGLATAGGIPGRMETVTVGAPGSTPLGVVDYAHSPDSISSALAALRATGAGPLAIVFGAGGDRDRGKRQNMGAAAVRGADIVVVTDDNPRTEDPAQIRASVLAGARAALTEDASALGQVELVEVAGRREAIALAVDLVLRRAGGSGAGGDGARPTLLIAGKGHETGQEIAGTVHPFDDRVELRAALDAALGGQKETKA